MSDIEAFPGEEEIANAVFAYSGDVYSMSDVLRFLNINDINKPNTVRLICWLVGLKLMPSDRMRWIPEMLRLSTYYKRSCERYIPGTYRTPLEALRVANVGVMRDSIHERLPWFSKVASVFKVKPEDIADVELRVQRIFTILIYDSSGFEFQPGYEYFAFYTFLVAYMFSVKGGLPVVFAEALAAHMTRSWISIIAFTRHLDDLKASQDHVDELYRLAEKFCPKVLKGMASADIDFLDFTSRWESCLFASLHAPWNLLLIWDQILFHLGEYREYLRFLIICHYRAMDAASVDFMSQESIDEMKWNAMEIIDDAEALPEQDRYNPYKLILQVTCPCFPFLHKYF